MGVREQDEDQVPCVVQGLRNFRGRKFLRGKIIRAIQLAISEEREKPTVLGERKASWTTLFLGFKKKRKGRPEEKRKEERRKKRRRRRQRRGWSGGDERRSLKRSSATVGRTVEEGKTSTISPSGVIFIVVFQNINTFHWIGVPRLLSREVGESL